MIEISELVEKLQTDLNANSENIVFKIFDDDGNFQKSIRDLNTVTRYVNGVYSVLSSELMPFKSIKMYTMTATLNLIIDVEGMAKDQNGNYVAIEKIKKILNDYGASQNGQIFEIENQDYQISAVYNFATVGTETVLSPIGRCIPMQMWIRYQFVENGVNSNVANLWINGENIAFNTCALSRVRTMTNNNYGDDVATKATGEQNSFGIDVTMPLLSNGISKLLTKDVLYGGNNKALMVGVEYNGEQAAYLMTLGNNASNLEINKNVGQPFSLVEIMPEIADIDWTGDGSKIFFKKSVTDNYSGSVEVPANDFIGFVIWGDGTSDILTFENTEEYGNGRIKTHQYKKQGNYEILAFVNMINDNLFEISEDGALSYAHINHWWEEQITKIELPNYLNDKLVTSIAENGFFQQIRIKELKLPDFITNIGNDAFKNCTKISHLDIPERVIRVGDYSFALCYDIIDVNLDKNVTYIGNGVFDGCSKLKTMTILAKTPPTLGTSAIPTTIETIYIPAGTIEAYKAATNWANFADKFIEL